MAIQKYNKSSVISVKILRDTIFHCLVSKVTLTRDMIKGNYSTFDYFFIYTSFDAHFVSDHFDHGVLSMKCHFRNCLSRVVGITRT